MKTYHKTGSIYWYGTTSASRYEGLAVFSIQSSGSAGSSWNSLFTRVSVEDVH